MLAFVGIGLLVGFRHAFEPDHLAAISMFASRERGTRRAARLGIAWGVGHTTSVAVVAGVVSVLGVQVSDAFSATFELLVAAALIVMGLSTLIHDARRHRRMLGRAHETAHGAGAAHVHPERVRNAGAAFAFGVTHGLAGSGAVIILLVAAAATMHAQVAYLLAFGLGTIAGMCAVSMVVSGAAQLATLRSQQLTSGMRTTAAAASLMVGIMLGWRVLSGA